MAVTLRRQPFTESERAQIVDAVLSGCAADAVIDGIALQIAEKLPDLLKRSGLPDNSENRRQIVDLVLTRWSQPKARRASRSYQRLARQ